MISQAKDAQQGTPEHSQALAAGLRALREAKDFEPYGTQLEAELDIHVLCASHRTPIAQREDAENLLPRLMMDRYLRYAQLQLAWSVAGEPTGSMALHALGKLNSRLARVEPDNHRLADRYAIAYQQAALLAHNQNYLATHELGVLLAASGHLEESQRLLQDVSRRSPNAIVYQNLAYVQEKLGQPNAAGANRNYAQQLRQQGMTGTHGVRWVAPEEFVQSPAFPAKPPTAPTASPSPRLAMAPMHPAARPPQQGPTPVRVLPGARQAPMTTLTR
jgi:tetratricopeptide (TPR) repeat protein